MIPLQVPSSVEHVPGPDIITAPNISVLEFIMNPEPSIGFYLQKMDPDNQLLSTNINGFLK